ncbi:MAG: hypothetical protein V1787_01805 [Candidatus Micrarchaeota archaeon]
MEAGRVAEIAKRIAEEIERSGLAEPYKSAAFQAALADALRREEAGTAEGAKLVEFQDAQTPVFHFALPRESRAELQAQGILLLLLALKRTFNRISATSNELSRMLHTAGMDNERIDIPIARLKKEEPKLVAAARRGRRLSLTAAGEQRAAALWARLSSK